MVVKVILVYVPFILKLRVIYTSQSLYMYV